MHAIKGTYNHGQLILDSAPPMHQAKIIILFTEELTPEAQIPSAPDTWEDLDALVDAMQNKPAFEDFPRTQLGRNPMFFEEA